MLSYEKAKALFKEHEEVEQTLAKLKEEREAIDAQILAQELRITEIEGSFKADEPEKKINPKTMEEFKELAKKAFIIEKEPEIEKAKEEAEKEPVRDLPVEDKKEPETGRKTSIYRIKGEK